MTKSVLKKLKSSILLSKLLLTEADEPVLITGERLQSDYISEHIWTVAQSLLIRPLVKLYHCEETTQKTPFSPRDRVSLLKS